MQPAPTDTTEPVTGLGYRAADDLHYIRRTMEQAGSFTAVPGVGGVLMGCVALLASLLAASRTSAGEWVLTWLVAAAVAFLVGGLAVALKVRRGGVSLVSGPGWRFVLAFSPPVVAGALLTWVFWNGGLVSALPGVWLLLYGAGVVTGGLFSLPLVRWMGLGFMLAGAAALMTPAAWGDAWMALGFGGLQILVGLVIARRHGG